MILIKSILALSRRSKFTDPIRLQLLVTNSYTQPVPLTWHLAALIPAPVGHKVIQLIEQEDDTDLACGANVNELHSSAPPLYSALMTDTGASLMGASRLRVSAMDHNIPVVTATILVQTELEPGSFKDAWDAAQAGGGELGEAGKPDPREQWDKLVRVVAAEQAKMEKPVVNWDPDWFKI